MAPVVFIQSHFLVDIDYTLLLPPSLDDEDRPRPVLCKGSEAYLAAAGERC